MSTDEHPNPPLPSLTAEDFDSGAGYTFRGVPLIENEDGEAVYAYGHVDHETMAAAVTAYDHEVCGSDEYSTDPDEVEHLYAVTLKTPADPEGWWISWRDVTTTTPGAFPVTVVSR